MATKKPVFVCLPGAAHGAWLFKLLIAELSSAEYQAVAIDRPGCRPLDDTKPPQDSMYPDADLACRTIEELLDSGHDVITVCHSYSGTVAGEAVGRVVASRQEKDGTGKGRILWMVYVGSYPVLENTACFDCGDKIFAALGAPKPADPSEFPFWDAKDGFVVPNASAGEYFLNDVPLEEREKWMKLLGKESIRVFLTPTTARIGFRSVPSTYIKTLQDACIPPPLQDMLVEQAIQSAEEQGGLKPFSDPELGRMEIDSSHSPMISRPRELKDLLLKVAQRAASAQMATHT